MRSVFLVILLLSSVAGLSRADDLKPGLVQNQFVSKPHITAPTGISVSPEGVVFVSCDMNGTTNTKRRAGKVVRCEDTDGDGQADKFSSFVESIDSPRGSCYVDDTLYLMQPPRLVAYQDLDGDGVAEKRTTLITNLGQGLESGGVVHGPNGIRMGIDGWLYLAIGDQGCYEATGTDGSMATLHGGGVLRVRPDGSQLGVLLTGTRNIYDVAVDPCVDLFARDNTNDGGGWGTRLHHLTELADFGYPNLYKNFGHEAMPSLVDYGAGSGSAMYYLHEPGFPEDYGDALYSGDFNTGVWIHRRKRFEASYQVQQDRFMNLPRNIGIDVDGFSRMYCASRLGGGFGFSSEPFGHVDLIQPADRTAAADFPDINGASDADLLTHLASRSQVARINAMREMVTRGSRAVFTKSLLALSEDSGAPLYARAAAVMTLKQLDGVKSHAALKKLYRDAELREFVVRALGDVTSEIDGTSKEILRQAFQDENPRVQMRAIVGLARSGDVNAAAAILPLAKNQKMIVDDRDTSVAQPDPEGWSAPQQVLGHTALKAVVRLNAADLLLSKLDDGELRETALRGLQEIHSEQVVHGLAAKVSDTDDKELAKLITLALFRLYHREAPWDGKTWWRNRPNFKGPYFKCQTWDHTPAVSAAIQASFRKVDPVDYRGLFQLMRMNQVPEGDLNLDIKYDEALSLLSKATLTQQELNFVIDAAVDATRPEKEQLQIYDYFKRGSLPDSYYNRVYILRKWDEGRAEGKLQRQAYAEFVSGREFIGNVEALAPFFDDSHRDSYKYAHLQLINLLNNPSIDSATRRSLDAELEKTWADKKNIYRPLRLRGLMLAFEEVDPTPYAQQLKPLVDHRDERVKQGAARYLQAISDARGDPKKD